MPSFAFLQTDGSTSSGNWLYCNSYTEKGNMAARRSRKDAPNNIGLYPEFAWCWPVNRRIIYNRASVDLKGQPWLLEMQPQVFVEMSEELAQLKEIKNGQRVKVSSPRGSLMATAIVTKRLQPFKIGGAVVHQVGLPWHYGWRMPVSGLEESANLLTAATGDPNTRIPETKAFMVNVSQK